MVSVSELEVLGNYFTALTLSSIVKWWPAGGCTPARTQRDARCENNEVDLVPDYQSSPEPPRTAKAAAKRVEDLAPVERQEVLPEEEHWTARAYSQSDVIHHKYLSTLVGT